MRRRGPTAEALAEAAVHGPPHVHVHVAAGAGLAAPLATPPGHAGHARPVSPHHRKLGGAGLKIGSGLGPAPLYALAALAWPSGSAGSRASNTGPWRSENLPLALPVPCQPRTLTPFSPRAKVGKNGSNQEEGMALTDTSEGISVTEAAEIYVQSLNHFQRSLEMTNANSDRKLNGKIIRERNIQRCLQMALSEDDFGSQSKIKTGFSFRSLSPLVSPKGRLFGRW